MVMTSTESKQRDELKCFFSFHFCFNLQISYETNFSEKTNNANTVKMARLEVHLAGNVSVNILQHAKIL